MVAAGKRPATSLAWDVDAKKRVNRRNDPDEPELQRLEMGAPTWTSRRKRPAAAMTGVHAHAGDTSPGRPRRRCGKSRTSARRQAGRSYILYVAQEEVIEVGLVARGFLADSSVAAQPYRPLNDADRRRKKASISSADTAPRPAGEVRTESARSVTK